MKINVSFGKKEKRPLSPLEEFQKEEKKLTRMKKWDKAITTGSTITAVAGFGVFIFGGLLATGAQNGAFGKEVADFMHENHDAIFTNLARTIIPGFIGLGMLVTSNRHEDIMRQEEKVSQMRNNLEGGTIDLGYNYEDVTSQPEPFSPATKPLLPQ